MTRAIPLALLLAVPAAAAPLPDAERERLAVVHTFGVWTDPHRVASFAGGPTRVRVALGPRAPEPLEWIDGSVGAPGFFRHVTGDFTAVARVDVAAGAVVRRNPIYAAGRLFATDGTGNCVGAQLSTRYFDENRVALERFHCDESACRFWVVAARDELRRGFVRLVRAGSAVTVGGSWDGETWINHPPVEVPWGPTVRLGLVAENTSGFRAEVTFDQFTLTQPKKGPEATP